MSDTHVGSRTAIFPREPYTTIDEELTVKSNAVGRWLFDCWEMGWGQVRDYVGKDPWAFAHVGDAIEGLHHQKSQLYLHELADQQAVCEALLEPHLVDTPNPPKRKLFVAGTSCHVGATAENKIAKKFGFERHPDTGKYADDRWNVRIHDYPILLRHHISVTSREHLRASALSIELANAQTAAVRRGQPIPNGLIGAHRHMHDVYTDSRNFALVCGPWQLSTRYGHTKWSDMTPEPTLCVLDWRRKPRGACPHIEVFKFTPPRPTECVL